MEGYCNFKKYFEEDEDSVFSAIFCKIYKRINFDKINVNKNIINSNRIFYEYKELTYSEATQLNISELLFLHPTARITLPI